MHCSNYADGIPICPMGGVHCPCPDAQLVVTEILCIHSCRSMLYSRVWYTFPTKPGQGLYIGNRHFSWMQNFFSSGHIFASNALLWCIMERAGALILMLGRARRMASNAHLGTPEMKRVPSLDKWMHQVGNKFNHGGSLFHKWFKRTQIATAANFHSSIRG